MGKEAIFISYRRSDAADVAGRIHDALAGAFGSDRVFIDVNSLQPGADFADRIHEVLAGCRVALVLIGENWISVRDSNGRRRIDEPHDWVRIEVETALNATGVEVVPVLINGAKLPTAEDLPDTMWKILRRQAAVVRQDPDFHTDLARLVSGLKARLPDDHRSQKLQLGQRLFGSQRIWVFASSLVVAAFCAVVALIAWPADLAKSAQPIPSLTELLGEPIGLNESAQRGQSAFDPNRDPTGLSVISDEAQVKLLHLIEQGQLQPEQAIELAKLMTIQRDVRTAVASHAVNNGGWFNNSTNPLSFFDGSPDELAALLTSNDASERRLAMIFVESATARLAHVDDDARSADR